MLKWLILPFAMFWWSMAHAADRVMLSPGEAVEVGIAPDGKVTVGATTQAAPMNDFDAQVLAELSGVQAPPAAKVLPAQVITRENGVSVPPVAPGSLRISLHDVPGKSPHERLLIIENGYGKALRYKAALRRGGQAKATDVCLVLPDKRGYEHWPYAFDGIDLDALTLVDWKESDGIPCE